MPTQLSQGRYRSLGIPLNMDAISQSIHRQRLGR